MRRILTLMTAGLLLAMIPVAVAADKKDKNEKTTRSVQGVVTDGSDGPIADAVVQLKDLKSLQVRSYITKAAGEFQFHGLNPNVDYELRAEHRGASSNSRTLSSFDSRQHATMNLKIEKK